MVMSRAYALSREEIIHALTAYTGITTADGAVTNDTLVDALLIGATDWITEKTILIDSGHSEHQDKGASGFNPVNGEIFFVSPCTDRIMAGTIYRVLNISSTELDVAFLLARMGTNVDPAGTNTLFAWFAKIFAAIPAPGADPWLTPVPGAYGAGTAGKILGTNLDALVSSRAISGDAMSLTVATLLIIQALLLSDTTPFPGADIPLIKTQTDKLAGAAPTESSVTKNWNTAVDSPDGVGGLVVNLGAAATKYKLHSLLLNVSALTVGAVITVKMFIKINGVPRQIYPDPISQTFTIGTDPNGLWVVNGTLAIHDILAVAVYSNTSESKAIGYTAVLEAM
jgi:hypothetical protein